MYRKSNWGGLNRLDGNDDFAQKQEDIGIIGPLGRLSMEICAPGPAVPITELNQELSAGPSRGNRLLRIIPEAIFDIYSLALPRGHDFGGATPTGAWINEDGSAWGCLLAETHEDTFRCFVMRRRVDQVWMETHNESGFTTKADAYAQIKAHAEAPGHVPIPPGASRRPILSDVEGRTPSDVFLHLASKSHHAAAWMLNQLYLALPNPDPNWASDCQTRGFHTRLWEAQLLASLREQGLLVSQPYESPDFRIEDEFGNVAWIEAVTANPPVPYNHYNAPPAEIPVGREALFFGPAALRFAKTLGNKLERRYDQLPHVVGQPFVLALADFRHPGRWFGVAKG